MDQDGFNFLHQIVYLGILQLGGEERDVHKYDITLKISSNEDLVYFYHQAIYME